MMEATLPDQTSQPIVVTARALPDPAAEQAYSVETIDIEQLQNAPSTQLEQVLKDVPGLQLFRRSDARSSHPTSQGITLRALGGNASSRALLVLDGVPQADPFGGWINWPAYDPASLAQVRIVRGGGSVGSGPGALAGTIELSSRLDAAVSADLTAGGRDSVEGRIFGATPIAGGTVAISGRAARGDGFIPITKETRGSADRPAPYEEGSIRTVWITPLGVNTDIQISTLAFTDRRQRGVAFTDNRTDGADVALRLVGKGSWQWSALGYAQWREFESSFAAVNDDRSMAVRVALQDSVPSEAIGGSFEARPPLGSKVELRLGGDFRRTEGESRELFAYAAGEPTRRRRAGGDSVTSGAFAEVTADIGKLTLSGGARLDHWRISDGELVERIIATGSLRDELYPSRSGWLPTTRTGVVFKAGKGTTLSSAAYLGWRMPTLNELFRPFRAGSDATAANAFLEPERLAGAEAGVRYSWGGITLSATAFANRLSNAIANVSLSEGPGTFPGVGFVPAGGVYRQRQNLVAVRVYGLEASGQIKRGNFTAAIGASLTDAEVKADLAAAELDGLRPAQTPRFTATGSISWDSRGRALSLIIRHAGNQFEDDLNSEKLPAATTIDAFASWPLGKRVQLIARGENLLDETIVAGIASDGAVERATPRTLWIGLRIIR